MSDPDVPHYFNAHPVVPSQRRNVRVQLPDLSFEIETDAGVFSHGRVDAGSKILLLEAPTLPETGNFLDLGCGAGPLALTMAMRRPRAQIWAVDINERARTLTNDNAHRLGLDNVRVWSPEDILEQTDQRSTTFDVMSTTFDVMSTTFDVIWSNPPIKVGKVALHTLLSTWLARLSPQGVAVLVVHKNLGSDSLANWLTAQGWLVTRIASRQGYRVLTVNRRLG